VRGSALPVAELRWKQARATETRQKALEQLELLDKHGVDHLHPGEVEARVMKCDPRRFFGYNAQAVVDHEHDLVVALGLTSEENDFGQLVPMLQETRRVLGRVAKRTLGDAGYASGEQLHEAAEKRLPVLVQEHAEADKGLLPKSTFAYDQERDVYVCARGELLTLAGHTKKKSDASYESAVYRCHTPDCPERAACTTDRKGRSIARTPFDEDREHQRALLAKPEMRNLYELRKEIVEHLFGCIKGNDGFRRFTVRGLAKALAQWALACIAFNLRKLHGAWAGDLCRRAGSPAHV
jgi:Transposase DDE domain